MNDNDREPVEDAIPATDLFDYHRGEVLRLTTKSAQSSLGYGSVTAQLATAHAILAAALVNDPSRKERMSDVTKGYQSRRYQS